MSDSDDIPTPPFKVFSPPERDGVYVAGVDSAEGLGHGDNSVIQVLDFATGEQVAVYSDRCSPDVLALLAYRVGRWYNGALLVVESNNHGLVTLNGLRSLGYRSLYRRKQMNRVFNRTTDEYGFKTTMTTKPVIIADLEKALRADDVIVREYETIVELKGYVRDEKGRTNGSPFDDRVMALAMAHHGRQFIHQRVPETRVKDDYMTGGWWLRLLRGEDSKDSLVVGRHNHRRS